MKQKSLSIMALGLALLFFLPVMAAGQEKPVNYVVASLGMYTPTGDIDDANFDGGADLSLSYGRYINQNLALEAGLGIFHAEGEDSGPGISDADMVSPKIVFTAKGIYPTGKLELYGGGGVGVYFPELEVYFPGPGDIKEDDTVFGFHVLAGASYDITPYWYLGLEGRYLTTGDADFAGLEMNLDGFTLAFTLGLRF